MNIVRNAAITSAVLILGAGSVAQASGKHHGNPPTSYYGQPTTYYGQPTAPAALPSAPGVKAPHKQVLAEEVNHSYLFVSKTLKTKAGTTVTWLNKSDAAHNVTFDKNSKVNMDFKPNKSVSYTFAKAGTYKYHCEYHPYMKGTVIVK